MRKRTRDTKKNWHGWIDSEVMSKVAKVAEQKGVPVNIMVEYILAEYVKHK